MKPDLEQLRITGRELEELSGFDVSSVFIGGVLGGIVRPSVFQNPGRSFWFWLTEIIVSILVFIFTLPFGLLAVRDSANLASSFPIILRFLGTTLGITLIVVTGWNLYMRVKAKQLRMLMHLLDEVDKYSEVLQAVDILDQLDAIGIDPIGSIPNSLNRSEVLEALVVSRSSLISGLMTEKILRKSKGLLSRRYDLLTNIEDNLIALKALEVRHQGEEYGQLLNEALQIGMSVHQEVKKLR
jgi:hypothetical protein